MTETSKTIRRPPQMSLSFMMLMMVIFSVMSAGLFYASRVPVIQEDIQIMTTGETGSLSEDVGRRAHIAFIMFTFTSPLILAGLLATGRSVLLWTTQRVSHDPHK